MMHLTLHASNSTFRIYVNKKFLPVFILAYIVIITIVYIIGNLVF